jgi:hypothetical protein
MLATRKALDIAEFHTRRTARNRLIPESGGGADGGRPPLLGEGRVEASDGSSSTDAAPGSPPMVVSRRGAGAPVPAAPDGQPECRLRRVPAAPTRTAIPT